MLKEGQAYAYEDRVSIHIQSDLKKALKLEAVKNDVHLFAMANTAIKEYLDKINA